MSRPRRAAKVPTRFDEADEHDEQVPAAKRAKRAAGGSGKKPQASGQITIGANGGGGGGGGAAAGAGASAGGGNAAVNGSLAAVVAASPATMTASDREAVLSLLGIATPKRAANPGRELFPKGAAAAAGAGAAFSGGSPGAGPNKRAAGAGAGAGAVARPVKLPKSPSNTPRKNNKKIKAEKNTTPKGAKTPKTPKSTGAKPRGRQGGKGTPGRGTPRGGKAGLEAVPITKQMLELSVQLGKLVRNPLALKWCSFEHFYSSLDRGLLKDGNDFKEQMRALFPKIVEMENLKQFEWFVLRKALGRPRRFSPAFVRKEQYMLQQQRDLVRLLQQGIQPKDVDGIEVGQNVPLPLSIGRRVLAYTNPTPGIPGGWIFPGYILGINSAENAYRVEFDIPSLGIQTVKDTDLAPQKEPLKIPVNVLMKERVHVPSAGVTERPRIHRKVTSIQNLEQNRTQFDGGNNVMSTELMTHNNEDNAARSATHLEKHFAIADQIAAAVVDATIDPDDAAQGMLWARGDIRLVSVTENLLELKRSMLADQFILNSTVQRNLVEDAEPTPEQRQYYRFIIKYVAGINLVLRRCFVAIKQRRRAPPPPPAPGMPVAPPAPGLPLASSGSLGELEREPTEHAQQMMETAFTKLTRSGGEEHAASAAATAAVDGTGEGAGAAQGSDSDEPQQQDVQSKPLKDLIQHYTSMLLVVRSCAQGLESPEETAMMIREMQRDRKPVASSNKKSEEDVHLQLATLRSTVANELTAGSK